VPRLCQEYHYRARRANREICDTRIESGESAFYQPVVKAECLNEKATHPNYKQ
jgi:hypothetical protein